MGMIFLFFGPIIYIVVMIIGTIVSAGSKHYETPDLSLKDGKEYEHVHHPKPEYPEISEQLDDRLTNIVKNPFEGIL
jgi:hypothetical protein